MVFVVIGSPPTEIYTLSLHDALPISGETQTAARGVEGHEELGRGFDLAAGHGVQERALERHDRQDRKSTRLNSSHLGISYAVFCLKKKQSTTARLKDQHKPAATINTD